MQVALWLAEKQFSVVWLAGSPSSAVPPQNIPQLVPM